MEIGLSTLIIIVQSCEKCTMIFYSQVGHIKKNTQNQ
jgi:hypothetical protein